MREFTHDGQPLAQALKECNHHLPASLSGLTICITGIVPGFKGFGAERAAEMHGATTRKNVSSRCDLLVIGDNAGRDKLNRAQQYDTPVITAREFLAYV